MKTSFFFKIFFFLSLIVPLFGASENNPTLNITPATASFVEGSFETSQVTFDITIDECPNKKNITVEYFTVSETALEDDDFVKTHGAVTFSKSSWNICTKSYEITLDLTDDTDFEDNETFSINIQATSDQAFTNGNMSSVVTILNDDSTPLNTPPTIDTISDKTIYNTELFTLDIASYTHDEDNDTITYSLTGSLPTGLSFNTNSGLLNGTPDENGTFALSVLANDKDGSSNTVTFTLTLSDPLASATVIHNANDLCYDTITTNGFCMGMISMMCTITTPIKSVSVDSLSHVQTVLASTSMFSAFDSCGVDGTAGACEDSSAMSMMGMSALNNGISYTMPDYTSQDSHTTYTSAMFSFLNSDYEWLATYTKNGNTYQGVLNPCGTLLVEDPIFEQCGLFPSALNTWDGITVGNNDEVIYADTVFANNGVTTAQGASSSIECFDNPSSSIGNCNVEELTMNPPTLPEFINSTQSGAYTALGVENDSEYGDVSIASNTSVTFSSNTTYTDNTRKIMLMNSLTIHEGATVTFSAGDYYIGEWTNDKKLTVIADGPVRLFINGNMTLNNNFLDFNYDGGVGIPSDMFIFIGGNFNMTTSGGGSGYHITAFIFTNGTFDAGTNTHNSSFKGAVTAVGTITINNNQTYTYDDNGLDTYGFGDCNGGGTTPILGELDAWQTSISNRSITTKIVDKPFNIILASLTEDRTALQDRDAITVKYQLYNYDTNRSITDLEIWDISSGSPTLEKEFSNITTAYKNIRIRFKYCEDSTTSAIVDYARCSDNGYDYLQEIASSDNFAIRPYKFILSSVEGNLTSAQDYNFSIVAKDYSNNTADAYTISSSNYLLQTDTINYLPNDVQQDLNGTATIGTFNFTNGVSSPITMSFDDIGKVTLRVEDRDWTDVDSDDTTAECSETGRYICGDTNATFIPDHFTLSSVNLYNENNNSNFTYLSNDLNISAHIGLTLTAQNAQNNTTLNFDAASWENPVDINLSVSTANTPTIIKNEISTTQKIGFSNGIKIIAANESNNSRNLMFNFTREVNNALNPFVVNGSEVTLNASSAYDSTNITGASVADRNATFLYGRTHASRQRYENETGTANIYYESYCYNTECNKSLLPNGVNSKNSSDIRWFINKEHNSSTDGNITNTKIIEKRTTKVVTEISRDTSVSNITKITLNYKKSFGYPYKTTMENNASSWLIYNEDDSTATKNKFSVEFEGDNSNWSGHYDTTIRSKNTDYYKRSKAIRW